MIDFRLWFLTGVEHITDLNGYDHILFILLLVIAFPLRDWKKLLILITGFTVGHSLALVLSIKGFICLPPLFVEVFISLSIFLTAVFNSLNFNKTQVQNSKLLYFIITLFGGIHGLGFSYLLRSMLGHEQSSALPLLYFNLGLEVGQIFIVLIVLVFSLLLTEVLKCQFKIYKLVLSCIVALISFILLIERLLHTF